MDHHKKKTWVKFNTPDI